MKRLLILLALMLAGCSQNSPLNVPLLQSNLEHNEDCTNMRTFRVFQVFEGNYALANECNEDSLCAYNPIVLLTPHRGTDFYDDMMFTVPTDKCAVQDGIYKYESKDKRLRTVPRITYEYEYSPRSDEERAKRFYEVMEDLRYACKLSITNNKNQNTKANINKCDCVVDYITDELLNFKDKYSHNLDKDTFMKEFSNKIEKKCGRVPSGYRD